MPRNVRNFWLEVEVDGKATPVSCGPRNKDGGFSVRVFMRKDGEVWEAANLNGRVAGQTLSLVYVPDYGPETTHGPVGETLTRTTR